VLIFLRFRDLLWPHPPCSRSIPVDSRPVSALIAPTSTVRKREKARERERGREGGVLSREDAKRIASDIRRCAELIAPFPTIGCYVNPPPRSPLPVGIEFCCFERRRGLYRENNGVKWRLLAENGCQRRKDARARARASRASR